MTPLDHALEWINGELVGGGALIAFGLLLAGCSGLLWRFGESPAARAMVLPLLVTAGLITAMAAVAALNNVRRIAEFRDAYAVDPVTFVQQEIARVQDFMSWYVYTFAGASILIVAGLAAFLIAGAPTWKAAGLAMIILGTTALHIDFFSKASAKQYLQQLTLPDRGRAEAVPPGREPGGRVSRASSDRR